MHADFAILLPRCATYLLVATQGRGGTRARVVFVGFTESHLNALSLDLSRPRLFKTLPSLKSSRRPVYIPRATYYYKIFGINLVHAQFY